MNISSKLFEFSKTALGELIVGITFEKFSDLLPVERIKDNDKVIAFWHPRPVYEKHILVVPKKQIKNISSLDIKDREYITAIFDAIKEIVLEYGWEEDEYSVTINGGKRQDVRQLHFHLSKGKMI